MNDFQVQIWKNNYKAPQDKTIQDTFLRVAAAVAKAEPDKETRELLATQFYKIMSQWKFIPGGRIIANAGSGNKKATLYNCYVYHPYDFGIRDIDSMQGIFQTLKKSAKILASQGGLGVNLSFIRPNGSYIVGTGARTPGVVKFMELWDKASDVITMGSSKVINDKFTSKAKKKIRKGAMLCFSQNTLILTNNGWIPIKQVIQKLQNGEEVFAIFQDGRQYKAKNPIINEPSEIYEVQAEDGTKIQCTADHRFVVYNTKTNQQYLKAVCDINPQYQLIKIVKNNDGKYADNLVEMNQTKLETQYVKLKSITLKRVEKSYDFQVEETHRIIAKHPDSENAFVTSNCAMDISHPEIKDFIIAKQTSNRLTKFNLSVLVPDRFMKALDANQMWKLCFPDIEYANYKEQWDGDLQRWISQGKPIVVYEQIPARELWDMIMLSTYNRNEPGILFYDTINDLNPVGYCQRILTTNPCLTGDTLVAVADGRNAVTIKQLAQEDKDVPVYCLDNKGKLDIQYMRNPRITGYNQKVYKVTLDDGNSIMCTGNHKFILRDGSIKQALELLQGDSLLVHKKVAKSANELFGNKSGGKSLYYGFITPYDKAPIFEHRIVVNKLSKQNYVRGTVIHHKDFNSLNNNIENLLVMNKEQHDALHRQGMLGDRNPMRRWYPNATLEQKKRYHDNMSKAIGGQKNWKYSGITNQQLYTLILNFVKNTGLPITNRRYIEFAKDNNLPVWNGKNAYRGSLLHDFLNKANMQCGYQVYGNPIIQKQYYKYNEILNGTNLDVEFEEETGNIYVYKICQQCGKAFKVLWAKRQICICSEQCATVYKLNNTNRYIRGFDNNKLNHKAKFLIRKDKVDEYFVNYIKTNKQIPLPAVMYEFLQNNFISDFTSIRSASYQDYINEWYCSKYGLERITTNGLNQNSEYRKQRAMQLLQKGLYYNHKVVSVEYVGKQNVYNGTVDLHHNFGICLSNFNNDKKIQANDFIDIVYTLQCGEIPQPSNVCNLGSLNLVRFVNDGKFDWEEFQKVIKLAVCFLDNVADISFVPLSEYEQKIKQKRRIGLGVMGLGSLLMMMKLKFGSHEAIEFVDELFKFKAEVQLMTSAFLGKSKGSFTAFDREKYFTSRWWYELPISYKIKREIENIGQMRNSVHSDTAPTGNCVIKDTKIRTEQGIKSIKDIFEENQIVLNQNINQWYLPVKQLKVLTLNGYKRITGLYNNNVNRVYQIGTKDEQISGTAQHKVLVKVNDSQAKWVKLSQLKLGEKILIKKDSSQFEQKLISKIQILEDYTYDIQVEDQHHYILDNGIISHNSAIFAGQVSNGIQPVFMKEYTRWVTMTDQQVEQLQHRHQDYQMDKFTSGYELQNHIYQKIPNPKLGQWYQTAIFKFAERGNEQILRGQVDGVIYEIDKNRGLIKPMQVIDYGWKYVKQNIQSSHYDWCVTTNELTVEDHINMLATSAKYINQNQSKTINIVEDYSYQQFKNVYTSAWRKKIKGVTSYRAGTMTVVLEQKKKLQEQQTQLEKLFKGNNGDIIFQDVKLPEKSYALQYKVKDKYKKKWYFTISFADKELTKPFAFFIRTNNRQSNEVADLVIQSMQELLISLGIREDLIADQRQKYKDQTNVDKIGRAIGMALRHNIPIVKIVETLNTYNDGLSTLMFHVKKILSGFIKDGTKVTGGNCEICGSTELVYQSGCSTCNNCGSSKCQ